MRYRDSWTDPALLEPGRVYAIDITLPTTANLFRVGHRLRIDIASSNFPRLKVNAGELVGRHTVTVVATNAVHIGAQTHPLASIYRSCHSGNSSRNPAA